MLLPEIIIVGFSRVGLALAEAWLAKGLSPTSISTIEADVGKVEAARERGCRTVHADASEVSSLRVAMVGPALRVAVCIGDQPALGMVRAIRSIAPDALLQVVVQDGTLKASLKEAGADEVLVLGVLAGQLLARSVL